jgi:hypothetical protein
MAASTTKNPGYVRDNSGRFTKKTQLNADPTNSLAAIPTWIFVPPRAANTRSPSSISNFELVDCSQASTPFALTPSTTPTKTPPLELPDPGTPPDDDTMPTEHVDPFHGDKEDENPEDFLRAFFRRMGTSNDDVKKQQFRYFLQADSVADEWFDDLQPAEKKEWNAIEAAFSKCWPRQKAAKKTKEEYEEEITGLLLKMEDLGKREKTAGREVYSHIVLKCQH